MTATRLYATLNETASQLVAAAQAHEEYLQAATARASAKPAEAAAAAAAAAGPAAAAQDAHVNDLD